ncbi:MAG: hypothetical protein MR330_04970 [Rikenellaceae bacterium]|nr:hypothetical protein [Rikenellaceae bacterium]
MNYYFVYSSGGGAGDWGGVDRVFRQSMPEYFKNHILLKFGDIFFNHRSSTSIIKPKMWREISDAKAWIIGNTNDDSIRAYEDMILDVGTTKIVSYITSDDADISARQLIARFDRILEDEGVLDKFCDIIETSGINNAVTFDIPNLFKVRSQIGSVSRDLFTEGNCKDDLIDACARYANYIYHKLHGQEEKLLTIVNLCWSKADVNNYLDKLDYTPSKLGVGGAAFYSYDNMGAALQQMDSVLDFSHYDRVHFLGCGGMRRSAIIKEYVGNSNTFSVDNTTPYNRGIDGSTDGRTQSGYFDYVSGEMIRISPLTKNEILRLHRISVERGIAHFGLEEMEEIISGVLQHQSKLSNQYTYECRAKLIIHNFHVFKYKAE